MVWIFGYLGFSSQRYLVNIGLAVVHFAASPDIVSCLNTTRTHICSNTRNKYLIFEAIIGDFQAEGGCSFFQWVDPEVSERAKKIIPGLLRRIDQLQLDIEHHCRANRRLRLIIVLLVIMMFAVIYVCMM